MFNSIAYNGIFNQITVSLAKALANSFIKIVENASNYTTEHLESQIFWEP